MLILLGLLALHVAAALYFVPPEVLFGKYPLYGQDYDTHISQTWRVIEGLHGWGESWVYDVHLLAGHPNGVIFDADNKGWEYLTYGLVKLGVRRALAFNTFIMLAHLLVVPLFFVSARLFGSTQRASLTAAALASGLWLFDSYNHWIWWVGTLAFAFASYFAVLPLALFYRFIQGKRALHAALCALVLAIGLLIHPYTFFVLVVPMGILYLRAARSLGARGHAWTAAIVLAAIAGNAEWLLRSIEHWHYILDSAFFGRASPVQLPADFFGFVVETAATGIIPTRTSVRFLCFAAALVTLLYYAREKDSRALPLTAALGFMLGMAYLSTWSHWALQLQPYRFVGSAMFLAAIPAADLLPLLQRELQWRALPKLVQSAALVVALLAAQNIGRDVVSYFPTLLPDVPTLLDGLDPPISNSGYPLLTNYRHQPDHPVFWALAKWVTQVDDGRGRFLVQNGAVGEQLTWKTNAEILGGFVLRNLEHAHANLFRRRLEHDMTPAEVRAYLEAYAVQWVLLTFKDEWFATMPELFELYPEVTGTTVLRTKVPISRFERGSGEISASTNRVTVRNTDPTQDLVLRYHFHEQLGSTRRREPSNFNELPVPIPLCA